MRIERLVTETETHSVALDFHPRLTVIGGLDGHDRERLVDEVLNGLAGARSGIHLELLADSGARFAVFRPSTSRHRIVEIDTRLDATETYADEHGRIDLLARCELDLPSAQVAIQLTAPDLLAASDKDRMVQALANANQSELWVAADGLAAAQRRLETEALAAQDEVDNTPAADDLESRHEELEDLRSKTAQVLRLTCVAGAVAAVATIAGVVLDALTATLPLVGVALCMVAQSLLMRSRIQRKAKAEAEALAEFGAQSYLGFHIQRVNGLFDSEQTRRSLMAAADDQRAAFARWTQVAGTAELAWALRHRSEIDAAARTRREVFGTEAPFDSPEGLRVVQTAHAIVRRLAELRRLGVGNESFLALFNEPFDSMGADAIAPLLELLVRSSEQQQIVILTESPAIISWAKVEAMTGVLSLIEPNGASPDPTPPNVGDFGVQRSPVDEHIAPN